MFLRQLIICASALTYTCVLQAQQKTEVADNLTVALSQKYLDKVNNKISALNRGIEKKSLNIIQHLEKQENKIQKKLEAKDSIAAQQLFAVKDRYQSLKEQIKKPLNSKGLNEYIPEFDSLKTALGFLSQQGSSLTSKVPKQ